MDASQWNLIHHHGPECVEEDLEGTEEGLSEDRVEEEGLKSGGEIGVKAIYAERLVVRQVVRLLRWSAFVIQSLEK